MGAQFLTIKERSYKEEANARMKLVVFNLNWSSCSIQFNR